MVRGASAYTLNKKIAHGTFATVFAATSGGGEACALKVFVPGETCDTEREALESLCHPNVIKLLEAFVVEGPKPTHVLALPLCETDLYARIHEAGEPTPLAHVKGYARQILAALSAFEDAGIIHTDLKPENVLLTRASRHDTGLVVADFGSAVRTGHRARTYGHTLEYRSPEMIFDERLCPASDTWAAATIVCELVTGDFLFSPRDSRGLASEARDASQSSCTTVDDALDAEHLALMVELLGEFPRKIARRNRRFFNARGRLRGPAETQSFGLGDILRDECPRYTAAERDAIVDFVEPMLMYNPRRRAKASQHAEHPWLVAQPSAACEEVVVTRDKKVK